MTIDNPLIIVHGDTATSQVIFTEYRQEKVGDPMKMTTQGNDVVCVASVSTRPDPRNPGQTYTTTHFDMWRFVDGKADEHWDEGQINAAPAGGRAPGGPPPGARQ